MKAPLEKQVLAACLEYLQRKGYFVWRNNTGVQVLEYKGKKRLLRSGLTGSADILGLLKNGRFLAVECKRQGNVLSEAQRAFKEQIEANQGLYITAYSIDDLIANGL